MATYRIDHTGAIPSSYVNHAWANAAAVAAADPAPVFSTDRAGDYPNQIINGVALSNASYIDTVGGDYTIGLDVSVAAAWQPGPGTTMTGGKIRGGGRDSIRLQAGCTLTRIGVEWQIVDAGYGYGCRLNGAGAALVDLNCKISTGGTGAKVLSAVVRIRPGAVATSVTWENVGVTSDIQCAYGAIHAWEGTPSIIIRGCGEGSNSALETLLYVSAGLTLPVLTIQGSHARELVRAAGAMTVTAGTFAHNVYEHTAAGTSSATDKGGIVDRRLGGIDGLTPLHDSPLRNVIPLADTVGTQKYDMYGNPRYRGRRQCVGPVQPQDIAKYRFSRGLAAVA